MESDKSQGVVDQTQKQVAQGALPQMDMTDPNVINAILQQQHQQYFMMQQQ